MRQTDGNRTCDGSRDPDVHAEPLDAQIPFMSSIDQKGLSLDELEADVYIIWKTFCSVSIQTTYGIS